MSLRPVIGAAAVLVGASLCACSLAPRYQPPPTPEIARYREAGSWMPAQPADRAPRGPWWLAFGDSGLDALERCLDQSNPDLQAALARFEQARAVAVTARSGLFPALNAAASVTRAHPSANAPLARPPGSHGGVSDDFLAELSLAWEIDLFGRLRNAAAAAAAQAQAGAADLAALRLSLQAELATDYFSLRGADATAQLLENAVGTFDAAYAHTLERHRRGAAAGADVDQADAQRQSARAQLAAIRLQRAQLEHALAVLTGEPPAQFSLPAGALAAAPPHIDAGLPSTLLQRRPDVAGAERAMAAANARIGIARAAWFPVFTLGNAAAGLESAAAGSWLTAPSRFWSIGPAAGVGVLDAGARAAGNRQARAAYDEAAANYRKITLTAYQEVEDSLAGLHYLADQLAADVAAAAAARSAAHHSDERYDAGVADYIEVTSTHATALQAERDAIGARVGALDAAVTLVRATGGGWNETQLAHAQGTGEAP